MSQQTEAVVRVHRHRTSWSDHDLPPPIHREGVRFEKRPAQRPDGKLVAGPLQRLDHPRQPEPVQLLHDRHGEGGDPRLPRGVQRPRRRRGRLHRRRRQGVLHRRQHQGVRRVLRRQPAGVPAVHAAVQRHGERHPRLRQAGDLPRERHAHRRRPGDRHGLRLHRSRRTSRASARPARSTARRRSAARPTSCRCSSASSARWRPACCASPGRRTAPTARGSSPTWSRR